MEVIEHVPSVPHFLSDLEELLKPGGVLFISTMSKTPLSYFKTILMAEYVLGVVPIGTHTFSKYINPQDLRAGCSQLGLSHLKTQGYCYDPLTNTMRKENLSLVNYISAFRKENI